MRDLRAVIHGITTAVLCGVAVFSCSTISKAAGETYQTAVEAAYGDTRIKQLKDIWQGTLLLYALW